MAEPEFDMLVVTLVDGERLESAEGDTVVVMDGLAESDADGLRLRVRDAQPETVSEAVPDGVTETLRDTPAPMLGDGVVDVLTDGERLGVDDADRLGDADPDVLAERDEEIVTETVTDGVGDRAGESETSLFVAETVDEGESVAETVIESDCDEDAVIVAETDAVAVDESDSVLVLEPVSVIVLVSVGVDAFDGIVGIVVIERLVELVIDVSADAVRDGDIVGESVPETESVPDDEADGESDCVFEAVVEPDCVGEVEKDPLSVGDADAHRVVVGDVDMEREDVMHRVAVLVTDTDAVGEAMIFTVADARCEGVERKLVTDGDVLAETDGELDMETLVQPLDEALVLAEAETDGEGVEVVDMQRVAEFVRVTVGHALMERVPEIDGVLDPERDGVPVRALEGDDVPDLEPDAVVHGDTDADGETLASPSTFAVTEGEKESEAVADTVGVLERGTEPERVVERDMESVTVPDDEYDADRDMVDVTEPVDDVVVELEPETDGDALSVKETEGDGVCDREPVEQRLMVGVPEDVEEVEGELETVLLLELNVPPCTASGSDASSRALVDSAARGSESARMAVEYSVAPPPTADASDNKSAVRRSAIFGAAVYVLWARCGLTIGPAAGVEKMSRTF